MDLKSTYNKIAKDWMEDHRGDTWWIEGTDKYVSLFNPEAKILDVGCGAGEKSKYLADRGFHVVGIDFSEEMIKLAKEEAPNCRFLIKDIKKPLNLDEEFDGVFAQAILLHIPKNETLAVLKNITQNLKQGGYLFVGVKELTPGTEDEKVMKENDYGYEYERFFSYFTLEEIKNYVQKLKMEIIYEKIVSSGKMNWIQIIAKNK